MRLKLFLALIIISGSAKVNAQAIRKYSNEFLNIGVGARAFGMGGAYGAIANDATAAYWNPAGLTSITSNIQLAFMHNEYFSGAAKYDYGTIAFPAHGGVMGFSVIRFAVDNIPNTTELYDGNGNPNYDRVSTFSASDYAIIGSFAKKPSHQYQLSYGGNVKIIYRNVGAFAKAWGFGFDLGAQYEKDNLRYGVTLRDASSTFNAWSIDAKRFEQVFKQTNNELPTGGLEITAPRLIPSVAYHFLFKEHFKALGVIDLETSFDGRKNAIISTKFINIEPRVGLELGYKDQVFVRAGVRNIQKVQEITGTSTIFQPSVGAGVKFKRLSFDYALTNLGYKDVMPYSHVISMKLDINRTTNETKNESPSEAK